MPRCWRFEPSGHRQLDWRCAHLAPTAYTDPGGRIHGGGERRYACDTTVFHAVIAARFAAATIPARKNARTLKGLRCWSPGPHEYLVLDAVFEPVRGRERHARCVCPEWTGAVVVALGGANAQQRRLVQGVFKKARLCLSCNK